MEEERRLGNVGWTRFMAQRNFKRHMKPIEK